MPLAQESCGLGKGVARTDQGDDLSGASTCRQRQFDATRYDAIEAIARLAALEELRPGADIEPDGALCDTRERLRCEPREERYRREQDTGCGVLFLHGRHRRIISASRRRLL